ncbi:nitrilases [Peptoniphilus sp. ING2-D1G]|nr:nitrilases [Peptoniphilus sp. ING2-D1G]
MIKVAMCQMVGEKDAKYNTDKMVEMIERACNMEKNIDLIVFPEYSYGVKPDIAPLAAKGFHTEKISECAKKYNVNILGGSFPRLADDGKSYNTVYFYDRKGEIIGQYDKTHLFVALGYDESESVVPGDKLCVIDTDFGRVGIMVCYELRFPEVARTMVLQGADIILCPADFPSGNPLPPRTDHWDVLVQSTALSNVTYTVAVNDFGKTPGGEIPFGRSMIVDPWGTIVSQCKAEEDIAFGYIDLDYQDRVRKSIASWENRRPELYDL